MQVCLATQLAHLGSWVPAKSMELTPADAIFVRMGARDSIVQGQVSTQSSVLVLISRGNMLIKETGALRVLVCFACDLQAREGVL